jgi:hypothetical protein
MQKLREIWWVLRGERPLLLFGRQCPYTVGDDVMLAQAVWQVTRIVQPQPGSYEVWGRRRDA